MADVWEVEGWHAPKFSISLMFIHVRFFDVSGRYLHHRSSSRTTPLALIDHYM